MMAQHEFTALVATYAKHGWLLRRVVLRETRGRPSDLPPEVGFHIGVTDAAWFSRSPQRGPYPWEIRSLGPTQFALVEHLDENSPDFEEKLHETEKRLADALNTKRSA